MWKVLLLREKKSCGPTYMVYPILSIKLEDNLDVYQHLLSPSDYDVVFKDLEEKKNRKMWYMKANRGEH